MSQSDRTTTCAYCGVGCGVSLPQHNNRSIRVSGDKHHPANQGRLCVKGTHLGDVLPLKDRLLYPHINGERCSWETATSTIAEKIRTAQDTWGPDSVAFYLSGQLLTEDYYAANKLAKGFLGTANVDTNSRLCMSSAVAAHIRAFGEDAPPSNYEDIELADLVVLTGSNLAWTHPVLFQRMQQAQTKSPDKKLVVIDPRKSATAKEADLHLAIKPGTDGQLFNALLVYLADNCYVDQTYINNHVDGYEAALVTARADVGDDIAQQAEMCGLTVADLTQFFSWFAQTTKTTTLWSMGINQSESGVDKGNALINCHLATGRIGKPGASAFSITGQPNAMGGREVGGLANQLAAHRMFDAQSIARVKAFWNAPHMATKPGLKAIDMFDAAAMGKIKVLWIMGTNPVASLPDAHKIKAALSAVETVIVSDVVNSNDTLPYARIKLPALAWGEKDGTVTNSERCISRQRAFLFAPGQAKADWAAIADVAKKLGHHDAFDWHHAHEVFREHASLTKLNDDSTLQFSLSDVADIRFRDYQEWQPKQWPLSRHKRADRLFSDGQFSTPSGKANMIAVTPTSLPTSTDLTLNTGRLRDQWHTMTRTGLAKSLTQHSQQFELHMNPTDARQLNIANGQLVKASSEQGSFFAIARLETAQQTGDVFAPMHWNQTFANQGGVANSIATIIDPISGQPAFKHTKVAVTPIKPKFSGFFFLKNDVDLPDWLEQTVFFKTVTDCGVLYHFFHLSQSYSEFLLAQESQKHRYHTDATQQSSLWVAGDQYGMTDWLKVSTHSVTWPDIDFLDFAATTDVDQLPITALFEGQTDDVAKLGRIVCTCYAVTDRQIKKFLTDNPGAKLEELQQQLKCSTNCGSCLSEVKDFVLQENAPDFADAMAS